MLIHGYCNRKIVTCDISKRKDSEFVKNLLVKCIIKHPGIKMIHSDQGSQYTAKSYLQILRNNDIEVSYSNKGYPYHSGQLY